MRRAFDFRHPSMTRLRQWLDTGDPDGVGEHVDECERCLERLETIALDTELDALASGSSLGPALAALVAPPVDLTDRVLHGVERRQRNERELTLIAGLFSVGVETAKLLLDPDDGDEHE